MYRKLSGSLVFLLSLNSMPLALAKDCGTTEDGTPIKMCGKLPTVEIVGSKSPPGGNVYLGTGGSSYAGGSVGGTGSRGGGGGASFSGKTSNNGPNDGKTPEEEFTFYEDGGEDRNPATSQPYALKGLMTNPKDGAKITDSDGNTLTYSAKYGGWMLPVLNVTTEEKTYLNYGYALPLIFLPAGVVAAEVLLVAGVGYMLYLAVDRYGVPYLMSKGGHKVIWPDQYGPVPDAKKIDWGKYSPRDLADKLAKDLRDLARGPTSAHSYAEKWLRDKREQVVNQKKNGGRTGRGSKRR